MRAMNGSLVPNLGPALSSQSSSAAKDLADYVAMSTEADQVLPSAAPSGVDPGRVLTNDTVVDDGSGEGKRARPREIGGRDGPEPTRFGDWEKSGRCIDF